MRRKRKIGSVFLMLLVSGLVFAQNSRFVGVSEGDVQNWVKNFAEVHKEFIKLGLDSGLDLAQIPNISPDEKDKLELVLNKYGIFGTDCLERFAIITHCAIILASDNEMDEESKANMKAMGVDPIAELKSEINSKDYAVIVANKSAIIQVINGN